MSHEKTAAGWDNLIEARARIAELEAAIERSVHIIDANLRHQREKLEDAAQILRVALIKGEAVRLADGYRYRLGADGKAVKLPD